MSTVNKPNILLIHADQFRGDCLSIEGHPILSTPSPDHLAPSANSELEGWRERLIHKLKDRPEGFSDGKKLIPFRPYHHAMPHTLSDE